MKNFDSKTYFSDCKYIGMFKDFFTYGINFASHHTSTLVPYFDYLYQFYILDKDLYGESYGVNYSVVYFDHFKMAMQRFWPPSIPILFSIEKVLSSGKISSFLSFAQAHMLIK